MYINFMNEDNKNIYISSWLLLITFLIALMIIIGGLTRLTDSGLSITKWQLFSGFMPPLTSDDWENYFNLYKEIPEFKLQNYSMTMSEFKIIFWWEWVHRFLGRLIGICFLLPLLFFTLKLGFKGLGKFYFIFLLICLQGFIGWYMVSSGLVDRIDVSHYRLALHLLIAFFILSLILWDYLKLKNIDLSHQKLNFYYPLVFLILIFCQIAIGAFVSGMDAGTIYNSWPLMGSSYFPDDSKFAEFFKITLFDNPSIVQFIHRNLAYLIVLIYLYMFYVVFKKGNIKLRLPILIIGVSLLLQIILGVLTILSGVKMIYASLHQINSILIILSTLYFLYITKHKEI